MKTLLRAVFLAVLCVSAANALPPITVPVYLEDNHAGAFYWLAQTLDLNETYTLLHFDAHNDATGIFDSDKLRDRMRRVVSRKERAERLEAWRRSGIVQCFDWIEPLMPSPIARVIWVPKETLTAEEAVRLETDAVKSLDGHIEAVPRRAGSFHGRFVVRDFDSLQKQPPDGEPLVVSVDLDFFTDEAAWERVWSFICELRNVRAICIAISRLYLTDDAQSHRLVQFALEGALSLPTARIIFEPFAVVGNDRSERARELRRESRPLPVYEIEKAPESLRALLLANRERIIVRRDAERWETLLEKWNKAAPEFRLVIKGASPSADGIWRVPVEKPVTVELRMLPWYEKAERVEWFAQTPRFASCNLTAKHADSGFFAIGAPPRPRWQDVPVADLHTFLNTGTDRGSVRLWARAHHKSGAIRQTPVLELRRFAGSGFRAALTEQFGLPYLFGSGLLQSADATGPETAWGNDCANFLIYALRRQGHRIPWGSPKQFREHLESLASPAVPGKTTFTPEDLEAGLIVHFGNHVAAVVEDRPPLGVLDENDLVAHHLEGFPEIVPLRDLLKTRRAELLRVSKPKPTARVIIGGDVMLARTIGQGIREGKNPFANIEPLWRDADLRVVNLECVISDKGQEIPRKTYVFRAPLEAVQTLANARVGAVSLANNHAFDCGEAAYDDCISRLQKAGITPMENAKVTFFPLPDGSTLAIIAYNALDETPATRQALAQALKQAQKQADWRICFVHWGIENTKTVTDEQRALARWLIAQGVDMVAGSHPHCVQPLEFYQGRAIAWSLGNLVFDGAPKLPEWNTGALLEIAFTRGHHTPYVRLIPVRTGAFY